MNKSNFGSINWRDILHGFFIVFISASLTGLIQTLEASQLPTLADVKTHIIVGLTAGVTYILKQLLQNSSGQLLKKEDK